MKKVSVVIGAGYGDCGKGLMTDYLCRKHNADLVVRFNGGAQAGHTVVTPEGDRHVFSHVGSGYFAGVPTYLSEFFVLNPLLFEKEYKELNIPDSYKIYVHPDCEITTSWDMMANQVKEDSRGDSRHGSCGVGFGETLVRAQDLHIHFTAGSTNFVTHIESITDYYKTTMRNIPEWVQQAFDVRDMMNETYKKSFDFMMKHIIVGTPEFNYAVFEGAQGLALDQFMGNFPYVTRSNTGMRNVIDLQRKLNFELDEVVYVSRTYETRHGAGPDFGGSTEPLEGTYDKTNAPNEYQGTLRYKELDYEALRVRIVTDVDANRIKKFKIALTHNDQIPVCVFDAHCENIYYNYLVSGETHLDVTEIKNDR